jgi:GDP-mannose 6-dehydrogenase
MVQAQGRRRVGVLGMSFKAGTDDLRESPMVSLIELLIGKGYDVRIYDRNVSMAKLMGANRDYILEHIPHIGNLIVDDAESLLAHAEMILIGTAEPEFVDIIGQASEQTLILDLVRIADPDPDQPGYEGVCW